MSEGDSPGLRDRERGCWARTRGTRIRLLRATRTLSATAAVSPDCALNNYTGRSMSLCTHESGYECVHVYMHVQARLRLCVHACLSMSTSVCTHVSREEYIHVYTCVWAGVCLCVHACPGMTMSMYTRMSGHNYVCVYTYVWA